MKIALIVPAIGNDQTVTTPVINALVQCLSVDVEIEVFPVRYPVGQADFQSLGATIHPIPVEGLRLRRLIPRMLAQLRAEHRRERFDLVHGLWLFESGALAILVARLLRIPSMVSIGGAEVVALPDIRYGGLLSHQERTIHRQVLRRATVVTGGSHYVLELAAGTVDRRAGYALAPLPVDTAPFQPGELPLLQDPERPRLLHAASLIPVKDQATLLRAFAMVRHSLPEATLDIAGEDPYGHRSELERLSASLGIADATRFLGSVPHADMAGLYQQADLFLLSSRHESQGMVVLEAAACGVPTVGTDVGAVRDLAPSAAMAVPAQDADALAEAIVSLLDDPERLRTLGAAARAQVERHYAPIPVAKRFLDLYAEACEGRRR